jgi:adenylate cyclase
VVGNVGSSDRMNYTALGATINLAARLEGLNKNYGTRVLVSATVRERAGNRFVFRCVDEIKPKGFAEAVKIFELRDLADQASEASLCRRWDIVYAAMRQNRPTAALVWVLDFLAQYPGDGVARYHAERLQGELQEPRLVSAGAMK